MRSYFQPQWLRTDVLFKILTCFDLRGYAKSIFTTINKMFNKYCRISHNSINKPLNNPFKMLHDYYQYKITPPTFSDPDRRLCFIVFTNSLLVFFVTKVTAHLYLNRHKYERVLLCAVDGKEMDSPQSDTKTKGVTPCPDTSAGGRHRDTPHTYTVLNI